MRKSLFNLTPVLIVSILLSCNDSEQNGDDGQGYSDINIPVSSAWHPSSENPVISFGDSINNAQWDAPAIIVEDGQYIMYVTANLGDFGEDVVPFRAVSGDGIHWTINENPVLAKGTSPTDIDFNGIETPTVVKFNGIYHMYYTVAPQDVIGSRAIGHATSENGIDWVKDPANPVLEPTGDRTDWNGIQVAEPGAIVYNGNMYVYFSAQGTFPEQTLPANDASIGVAISADGFFFEQQQQLLSLSLPYSMDDGFTGYGSPSAIVHNSEVHLFYDVFLYNEEENISLVRVALHHASSPDGVTNWLQDASAIFLRDSFTWSKREIRSPAVLVNNNTLHLWFGGDDLIANNAFWGIGYATADLDFLD